LVKDALILSYKCQNNLKFISSDKEEQQQRICFAKQFGLPHLLRMFVRFTDMVFSF